MNYCAQAGLPCCTLKSPSHLSYVLRMPSTEGTSKWLDNLTFQVMKCSYLCLKTPTIPCHPNSCARNWVGCIYNCFVNAFLIFDLSAN